MYDLEQLIEGAREYFRTNKHSRSSITHHETAWKRLRAWCEKKGLDGFDREAEWRYLEESGLMRDDLPRHVRTERGYVRCLLSIEETGAPPGRTFSSRYVVPPGFGAAYEAYAAELAARGLKSATQAGYLCTVRNFCANCGASGPEGLNALSIGKFAESIGGCAPQTRSSKLYVARDFLRHLAAIGMCGPEAAAAAPLIPGHKHSTAPSAYTAPEVSSLLGCFQRSLRPRRDRAIVLFAAVLGMRAGDIKALRLRDIDWRSKTVSFVQRKTQVANALPMPEEVLLALADYIKNERPDVEDGHVFITASPSAPTT